MQSFLVLASLVSELAGGQNDPPKSLTLQKHLSPLKVKNSCENGMVLQLVFVKDSPQQPSSHCVVIHF